MPAIIEGRHTDEFLLTEMPGSISLDTIQLASGSGWLVAGTVLGLVTASGLYVPHAPAATDGSQNAAAILRRKTRLDAANPVPASAVTRLAEVKGVALTLNAATDTDAEKAAVYVSLAAKNIIVR